MNKERGEARKYLMKKLILFPGIFLSIVIVTWMCTPGKEKIELNLIAEDYLQLGANVGIYADYYFDCYHKPKIKADSISLDSLRITASKLMSRIKEIDSQKLNELDRMRYTFLRTQVSAINAKISLLLGTKMSFDEESKALYDVVAPSYDKSYYENILNKLDGLLPGEGNIMDRYNAYRSEFIIPADKYRTVIDTAIKECRKRTMKYINLPKGESFKIEMVNGKPWGAFNWYKGDYHSLIQINTDVTPYIDEAVHVAGHEGYPGHHVYNLLLEKNLYRNRNWVEFSASVLYSPQAILVEGSANFGLELIFPGTERLEFEQKVIFPLAGLNPGKASLYYQIQELKEKLEYNLMEVTRQLLDKNIDESEALYRLTKFNLMTESRAKHILKAIQKYRSYIITYYFGKDMVKNYIEKQGGTEDNPEKRWALFVELLSTPQTPSGLQ